MARRQTEWARRKRDELLIALGRCCRVCGSEKNLEFDCIMPDQSRYHHRELSWDQRIRFYRKEFARKNVQLLCRRCHNKKTFKENQQECLPLYGGARVEPF